MRFNHQPLDRFLQPLGAGFLSLLYGSCRRQTQGQEQEKMLLTQPRPIIYAVWHCQFPYMLYYCRHRRGVVLASPSHDGAFIGNIAQRLGYIVLKGSRHKGGRAALQVMAGYLQTGYIAGLVADGSRGPARVLKKGVLALAREAQVPILPVAVASQHKIIFNSWDRFELTLPFSRISLLFGEPMYISPDDRGRRLELLRQELETRLNRLFLQSQHYPFSR
jgi:lysophospholipid acyltransferase (LPLAT)-like uncharacterized protein